MIKINKNYFIIVIDHCSIFHDTNHGFPWGFHEIPKQVGHLKLLFLGTRQLQLIGSSWRLEPAVKASAQGRTFGGKEL